MTTRTVGIASDHGGFELKDQLSSKVAAAGYKVVDFGAFVPNPADDYPDFVMARAEAVAAEHVAPGIAVCRSGVGACICANKVPSVRAALISDNFSARQGVEDDHTNVICPGGRTLGPAVAWESVQTFRPASFSHAERYLWRLAKVTRREQEATGMCASYVAEREADSGIPQVSAAEPDGVAPLAVQRGES